MRKMLASIGAVALLVGGVAGLSAANGGSEDEPNCQHYSLKGNSGIDKDETPVWPADYWQANTKQEPHLAGNGQPATWLGVEGIGLHYTSNESSGKRDWFYYSCVVSEPSPTPSEPSPSQSTTPAAPTPPASETPTPSQSSTPPAEPSPSTSETPTSTPEASVTPTPEASTTPTPTASVTPTPEASTTPKVTKTPKSTPSKSSTPVPVKTPVPSKTKTPKTSPPLPTCEDVAKEQAGKTYAKDSPESNGTACR